MTQVIEALQVLKFTFKKEWLDFTFEQLTQEGDYSIEGPILAQVMVELLRNGQYKVIREL
jgi:hypothetical protein